MTPILLPTWRVSVAVTAGIVRSKCLDAAEASDGIWLSGGRSSREHMRLTAEELDFLALGLRLTADGIRQGHYFRGPLAIHVMQVEFGECDYQPEGLACAMAGWAAQHFRLPPIDIPVQANRALNRYEFSFPAVP